MKIDAGKIYRSLSWLKERWFIIAVLFFSILLRLYKIAGDLPHTYWHDENNYVETALRFGTGNFKPHTLQHGMFLPLILFAEYSAYYLAKKIIRPSYTVLDFLAEYIKDPTNFYLISRITVMLFAIGCIILVYSISLKLYEKRTANLSSLLFSLTFVPFIQSKWTKAAMISVFFLLLAFLTITPLLTSNRKRRAGIGLYMLSGFFVGLATAAKLYSVFGFSFILLAHIYYYHENSPVKRPLYCLASIFDIKLISSGMAFIAGFIIGDPYVLVNPRFFYETVLLMHNEMFDPNVNPWLLYFKSHLNTVVGNRCLEILIVISVMVFMFRRSKKELVLLAYPVTHYLLFMYYPGFAHYLVPATPFLIIIAAVFLDTVCMRVSYGKVALVIATVFISIPCFLNILRYEMLISKPDTRTVAYDWIENNIPEKTSILQEGYIKSAAIQVPQIKGDIRTLIRDLEAVKMDGGGGALIEAEIRCAEKEQSIKRYNIYKTVDLDTALIKRIKPEYVVLSGYVDINSGEREYLRSKDFYTKRKLAYEELEKDYQSVKIFKPYPVIGNYFPLLLADDFKKIASIDLRKDLSILLRGPEIKIYRKKRAP